MSPKPFQRSVVMTASKIDRPPSVELMPAYRTLGVSPGDLIDVIRDEVDRTLKEAGGNRLKAINMGLRRMHSSGLITDSDLKRLEKANVIVLEVDAGKLSHSDGAAALDKLYLDAARDPKASSTGATMVGATYSARDKRVASAAGIMGMIIGGALTGGSPVGTLLGGLIGWTIGGGCKKD
jgi:hypothetical protein